MSAEVETMFYHGETPWHGQGVPVEHALTAAEAITMAGLNWEVAPMPIYVNNLAGNKGFTVIPNRNAIARQTDGKVLAVLGDGYTPVQNNEAFTFFDSVVGSKDAIYQTAGSLLGGRWVWILAKLNGVNSTISIKGDAVDKYLLLMNGHDGTLAFKMFFTPIRVVCYNTLTAADTTSRQAMRAGQQDGRFYARHSGSIHDRIEAARDVLGMSIKYYDVFAEQATRLANLQLPVAEMPKLLAAAFGTSGGIRVEDVVSLNDFTTRKREQVEVVTRLFDGEGKGLNEAGIKGTKWAAYNAVVEYVDYAKKYGGADPNDVRLKNTLFTKGARTKQRAWDYLNKS